MSVAGINGTVNYPVYTSGKATVTYQIITLANKLTRQKQEVYILCIGLIPRRAISH